MTNPCTDPTAIGIWNLLEQRRNWNAYALAPTRLKLISPYPANTKNQLDMRRKVEILKYQNQNSKSNNLTKAQKWSQMSSGKFKNISTYAIDNNSNNLNCESDELIPTLTTACDVPGPPIYLTYDPTVPLYNYININRNYIESFNGDTSIYKIYTENEIALIQNKAVIIDNSYIKTREQTLGSILINKSYDYLTTYNIGSPIAIWCRGIFIGNNYNKDTKTYDPRSTVNNITISITNISLKIDYNNTNLQSNQNIPFDLSSVTINPNLTNQQVFYVIQYVGMVNIPFQLNSIIEKSIYNLTLSFNYDYDTLNAKNINAFEAGIFCNLSPENQNIYANPDQSSVNVNAVISEPSKQPFVSNFINYNNLLNNV